MPCMIDTSALARMSDARVQARLVPILEAGDAATCAIIDLEVLYSTRSADEHRRTRRRRALAYAHVPLSEATFQRAIEVQGLLAQRGQHRVPIPDLIIAAALVGYIKRLRRIHPIGGCAPPVRSNTLERVDYPPSPVTGTTCLPPFHDLWTHLPGATTRAL